MYFPQFNRTICLLLAPLTVASVGSRGRSNLIACLSRQGKDIVRLCLEAAAFGLVGQHVKGDAPSSQFFEMALKLYTKPLWLSFVQCFLMFYVCAICDRNVLKKKSKLSCWAFKTPAHHVVLASHDFLLPTSR